MAAAGAEPHIPMSKGRKNIYTTATNKKAVKIEEPTKAEIKPPTQPFSSSGSSSTIKDAPVAEFVWPWGGERVSVAGSWNNWTPVSMLYDQMTRTHRVWIPSLPSGRVSYKFIVDGEWKYDGQKPVTMDECGNVNNVLEM